jgi:hypothetical protein
LADIEYNCDPKLYYRLWYVNCCTPATDLLH